MKNIELNFEQQLLILSLIRERKDEARKRLRTAHPQLHNFWIIELTKIRNLKRLIINEKDNSIT